MSFCTFNISRTFFVLWLKSNENCQSTFSSAPPYNISTEADNLRQSWADRVTVRDMTSAWNLREHWPSPWWDFNIPYSSDHHRRRKQSVSFGVGQHEQNNYQYLWVQCGQQHRRDHNTGGKTWFQHCQPRSYTSSLWAKQESFHESGRTRNPGSCPYLYLSWPQVSPRSCVYAPWGKQWGVLKVYPRKPCLAVCVGGGQQWTEASHPRFWRLCICYLSEVKNWPFHPYKALLHRVLCCQGATEAVWACYHEGGSGVCSLNTFDLGGCMKALPFIWIFPDEYKQHVVTPDSFHTAMNYTALQKFGITLVSWSTRSNTATLMTIFSRISHRIF